MQLTDLDGEYRTYNDWLANGRAVLNGQKADFYIVNPEGTESRAIFSREQTGPAGSSTEGWVTVVERDERPEARISKPKAIIEYLTEEKLLTVWVGANKKGIKLLQKNGYSFSPTGYRWMARGKELEQTYHGLEAWGFKVEAKLDGRPWSPAVPAVAV